MLGRYPAVGAIGRRGSAAPAKFNATAYTRAIGAVVVVPVIRITKIAYVLPGYATINRRLQGSFIEVIFHVPPDLHFKIRIWLTREVKARAYYKRLFVVVVAAGQAGYPGFGTGTSRVDNCFCRGTQSPGRSSTASYPAAWSIFKTFAIWQAGDCWYHRYTSGSRVIGRVTVVG